MSRFRVTIEELATVDESNDPAACDPIKRYEQVVDALDMKAVMKAVNTKPRAPRVRKSKEVK